MTYLVFSQEAGPLPFERLAAQATRFFATTLELLGESAATIALRAKTSRPALEGEFLITWRSATKDDLVAARDAEARGQAAGMAALAERCTQVWTIDALGGHVPSEAAFLTLAAVCASVALGPVLPPDGSTLFGVRGAIERRDRAAG